MAADEVQDLIQKLRSLQRSDAPTGPLRQELYDTMRTLMPSLEDPQDTINRIAYSPLQVTVAKIASDLGVFAIFAASNSHITTKDLAEITHSDQELLGRILRYLASMNMIDEVDVDIFTSSKVTETLSKPGFKAGISHNFDVLMPCWQHLPSFLKDTEYKNPSDVMHTPFQLGHNTEQPAFVWAMSQPQLAETFNLWMTATHEGHKSWLDVIPPERFSGGSGENTYLLVDIGGGVGHQCIALKDRLSKKSIPGRVVLQDLPMAIEHAIPCEGVDKMVFDFWGDQPIAGARVYYLRNIIHDYPDEKCLQLLSKTIAAMDTQSLLLIDDMVVPDVGAHWHAAQQDLSMLSSLASMERSERQWRILLGKAGLRVLEILPYTDKTRDSIIVTVAR